MKGKQRAAAARRHDAAATETEIQTYQHTVARITADNKEDPDRRRSAAAGPQDVAA